MITGSRSKDKIYVTTRVVMNFSVTHFLFIISQLPKRVYNKTVGRRGLISSTVQSCYPSEPKAYSYPALCTICH